MAFLRNILFCLSDVLLQRYDSANRRPILEKTLFHTVGSCTVHCGPSSSHVWLMVGVEGGPVYVGWPRIKRSLFFLKLFLESQNHREKLNL
jgi:hypothetical protein